MPKAVLYRMVLPDHECPFGVRAKTMLEDADFEIEEHILSDRDAVEAFKAEHGVSTTPQIFIDGKKSAVRTSLESSSSRTAEIKRRDSPGNSFGPLSVISSN